MNLTQFDLKRFGLQQWGALLLLAFVPVALYTGWVHGGWALVMLWTGAAMFVFHALSTVDYPRHDGHRTDQVRRR